MKYSVNLEYLKFVNHPRPGGIGVNEIKTRPAISRTAANEPLNHSVLCQTVREALKILLPCFSLAHLDGSITSGWWKWSFQLPVRPMLRKTL